MGDYNVSFWGPEQNKIKKLRKQSTPKVSTYMIEVTKKYFTFYRKIIFIFEKMA